MPTQTPSVVSRAKNLRLLSSLLEPLAVVTQRPTAHSNSSRSSIRTTNSLLKPLPASKHQSSTSASSAPSQSSVSETETSHFSRLASTWWDPHGPSRLLHLMNPLRHTFISSCLSSNTTSQLAYPNHEKKITYLDIGCGGGIFAESAARLSHTSTVTAIDPTPSVLAVAKAHQRTDPALAEPKLTYLNKAIEDLPIPDEVDDKADILTLFEVLEHIDHPSTFLQSCIPHLAPGGWIIGSTIARSPLSFLTTKIIAEAPVVGVVPRGTHDWNKYINPEELKGWFDKRGATRSTEEKWGQLRTQGVVYLPGWGWKMVDGTEGLGNYFFGVQRLDDSIE
jgi:polyprenyldihydroxybenzoate methyltransferase / 3-demethylubiquinol 3-O-methyltransferase